MAVDQVLSSENFPLEPERATLEGKNKFIGFWLFLGGETVMFASLFGTFLALRNSTMNGPTPEELFSMPLVFFATMCLLFSSVTSVYAIHQMKNNQYQAMLLWLWVTVILGASFLALEIYEFNHYVHEGLTFTTNAFSASFYTLTGFHGAHVAFGLCWIIVLLVRNARRNLSLYTAPKFYIASLYWHFIDVVWIFIFSIVYLMGMVG